MIKLTFEAETMSELLEDIATFTNSKLPTSATQAAPATEKKTRKSKDAPATASEPAKEPTPLEQSNAEHKAEEAAKEASVETKLTYTDLSKAVMEAVKVHDKPPVLEILRTFPHKEGKELVVNSPADIAETDYPMVIAAMTKKAAQPKAA